MSFYYVLITEYNYCYQGLRYVHNTQLKIHGHLTSHNCVIDSRFTLKLTNYGITAFYDKLKLNRSYEAKGQFRCISYSAFLMSNVACFTNAQCCTLQHVRCLYFTMSVTVYYTMPIIVITPCPVMFITPCPLLYISPCPAMYITPCPVMHITPDVII